MKVIDGKRSILTNVSMRTPEEAQEIFAQESEAWARGTVDGVDVPSTAEQYHNNSKYYAEVGQENVEAWATGKRGGVDVGSADPTYHNNAKYYSEQSADSATDAETAKTAAQAAQAAAETAAQTDLVEWLEENITNPDSPPLDRTLASSSAAAPADMVGDLKSALNLYANDTDNIFYGLTFEDENSIAFDGSATHFGNWFLSQYLDISEYKYISVRIIGFSSSIAPMIFYDASKAILSIPQESSYYKVTSSYSVLDCYGFIAIPDGAKYVRFNSYSLQSDNRVIKLYKKYPIPMVVAGDGSGDVYTINGAKSTVNNGGNVNLYLKNGTYREVVNFGNRYNSVTVVGEDVDKTIIIDGTGIYKNSPFVVMGNFYLENISFKATLDSVGSWTPTYNDNDVNNTYPSYALHIDGTSLDPSNNAYGYIRHCKMYSEAFPAVGMGVSQNQYVTFEECEIIRNSTNAIYHKDNWRGAFLCHNSTASNYVTNQNLILLRNIFKSNYGYSCHIRANLAITGSQEGFTLTAIDNVFDSADYGTNSCYYEKGKSNLNVVSKGNTSINLNMLHASYATSEYENLFDLPLNFKVGTLQNGGESPSAGWVICPYVIPVLGSTINYKCNALGGAIQLLVFYDKNYNVIDSYSPTAAGWTTGEYTVPTNTSIAYMRCCMNLSDNRGGYVGGKFKLA